MFKLPIDQLPKYRLGVLHNERLRGNGYEIKSILDVGAHHGNWSREVKGIFPNATVFMIEANPDCEPMLKETGFPYAIALLGAFEQDAVKYWKTNHRDTTGNSVYREQTAAYSDQMAEYVEVPSTTLARVCNHREVGPFDLIKLDVQGAELDIIRGSIDLIKQAKVVILEAQFVEYNKGAPMATDVIREMAEIGFEPFDILELHYTPGHVLLQVDMMFRPVGSYGVTDFTN